MSEPRPRARHLLLGAILVAAALLRLLHAGQGLRHTPHEDERYFVENVARMLATGSLDHGFYEYPGLLFYLLAPALALAGTGQPPGPRAYLAARLFIALAGVLAVALAGRFGRRLAGPAAGLWAAAFLAFSPVHVEAAHMLRPDVVLDALMVLFFLALLRLQEEGTPRADLRAGAALGLAVGLKFSAGLGAACLLAARFLAPGRRWRGLALAGLAGALVFALVSPYALVNAASFAQGVFTQLAYHYQPRPATPDPLLQRLLAYPSVWPKALGWPGALLALAGLALARREWRRFLPFVLLPPLTALVFSTTDYFYNRFMIPSLSVLAVLAGLALQAAGERRPRAALAAGLLALALPATASWRYLEAIGRPSTRDRVADWAARQLPGPARILTDVPQLDFDPRFELARPRFFDAGARLQAGESDLVVARPEDLPLFPGLAPVAEIDTRSPYEGPRLLLLQPARPVWSALPLAGARLSASASPERVEALRDGDLSTFWSVAAQRGQREWLELRFEAPRLLGRVELKLGDRPRDAGRGLRLLLSSDGRAFEPVRAWPGRPPTREQVPDLAPPSEVLLIEPRPALALRIERRGGERRWSVAELELSAPGPGVSGEAARK